MRVRVPLPPNFHFDAVVRSHGWYDLPPFSYDSKAGTLSTSVARGSRAVEITFRQVGDKLEVSSEGLDPRTASGIAKRVFSLDSDLESFVSSISEEPSLRRALVRGGGRMLRAPTLFEDAVKVLFTTNCSWEATRGMVQRLIAVAGPGGRAFPTAEVIARMSAARLKARVRCGYRAE